MKKIFTLLSVVALGISANAQTEVLNEPFSFTGPLKDNGWVTHSGTTGQLTADGSVANIVAGNSEDVNKAFSSVYATPASMYSKVEYSLTVNVASAAGLTTAGDYFLGIGGTAGTSMTTYYARLFIKGSTTGYTLGIMNTSGGTTTYAATEVPYGTPANILVTYVVDNTVTPGTHTATLKVDSQALVSNSNGTAGLPTQLASIAIREAGSSTSGTGNVTLDNIIVNTYTPSSLSSIDINKLKNNFVKNTKVNNEITFGEKANVKIYNVSGSLVKSAAVEKNVSLNVSSLPKGVYVVTGEVNGQAVSQKIVKQ